MSTGHRDPLQRLRSVKGFVFDMDGTLVLGDSLNKGLKPLPGAIALTKHLRERDVPFVILTNGTTRTPEQYAATLREVGFPVSDRRLLTPSARSPRTTCPGVDSNACWFREARECPRRSKRPESRWFGRRRAQTRRNAPACRVVDPIFVGWYREFSMDDLEAACQAVWAGARLFACSLAPFFATAHGKSPGTSRAICAMLTSITGQRAKVLGKPSLEALRCAARRLGIDPSELAVVGDDPALEVPGSSRRRLGNRSPHRRG